MLDLNDAEPQRTSDLIPDGTFAKVTLAIRPGGVNGHAAQDQGLLKASTQPGSDVLMLDCEFTVMAGPHVRRKFWQALTVAGGKVDEKGVSLGWSITKRTIRGILESAHGLDPNDESPAAKQKRTLPGFKAIDGIGFVAKVRVETGRDGQSEQNRLDYAVTPDMPEWAKIMNGEDVPARPGARRAPKAATPASAAAGPAWRSPGAAAPSPAPFPGAAAAPATAPAQGVGGAAWQQGQAAPHASQAPANAAGTNQQRPGPAWLNE